MDSVTNLRVVVVYTILQNRVGCSHVKLAIAIPLFSDTCSLQTSALIFKFFQHRTKQSFVLTANKLLVGTLMTIGDVTISITKYHLPASPGQRVNNSYKMVVKTSG